LAVIVKIDLIAGDRLFHADGYVIRVRPESVPTFSGNLKTLADVEPGTWLHFEGVRDGAGVLVARTAEFFPLGPRDSPAAIGASKARHVSDYQSVTQDSLLDANGHLVKLPAKVRYSEAGGPCGWHRVPADAPLQERVERIGMRLVPDFQKQLPPDNHSRIPFRFYAVTDDKIRSVFGCNAGLVLIPRNVVARLQNDDQLAAVLADGVAFYLQRPQVSTLDLAALGAEAASFIPPLSPAGFIAGDVVEGIAEHVKETRYQQGEARIALQLLADAGFNPWQAPEAWRLLVPKDPPQDAQPLTYPRESKYQLNILKTQYKRYSSGSAAELPAPAAGNSVR
jgi:hypothetical protein